jgi:putative transcriptional regulator
LAEAPKNYLKGKFYRSVKDHFLVATEKMTDSRFNKTVIVMLDNDKKSSFGLVINKPIGKVPLRFLINELQDQKNEKKELYNVEMPIFWGGPVDKKQIYILHSEEYKNKTTKNHKDISITRDYKILFDIAENKGPKNFLIILGYSGWADGQLEGEMEVDHWILSELDSQIIFEEESKNKWLKAYENSFIRL